MKEKTAKSYMSAETGLLEELDRLRATHAALAVRHYLIRRYSAH